MKPLFDWEDYESMTLEEFATTKLKQKCWILTSNTEVKTICLRERKK